MLLTLSKSSTNRASRVGFGIDRVEKLLLLLDIDDVGQGERLRVRLDVCQRRTQFVSRRIHKLIAHFFGEFLLGDVANDPHMASHGELPPTMQIGCRATRTIRRWPS